MAKLLGIVFLMKTSLLMERRLRTQADEDKTRARLVESEASAKESEREGERRAHRVINHTSKRVMTKTNFLPR